MKPTNEELICECTHRRMQHRIQRNMSCRKCKCKKFKSIVEAEKKPEVHPEDCGCPMCRLQRLEMAVLEVQIRSSVIWNYLKPQWDEQGLAVNPKTLELVPKSEVEAIEKELEEIKKEVEEDAT